MYFLCKMALILNIETAIDTASISLGDNGKSVGYDECTAKNAQASWLHTAIKELLKNCSVDLSALDAIAVSNGPGSYTGLRIGLSTAKGLCYALQKPLITINTLEIMASAVADKASDLICPMIDARRMEVFTALYDKQLHIIHEPYSLIIDKDSFKEILTSHNILFTGNGSQKLQNIIISNNMDINVNKINANSMLYISKILYINGIFAELAYTEPYYIKNVFL